MRRGGRAGLAALAAAGALALAGCGGGGGDGAEGPDSTAATSPATTAGTTTAAPARPTLAASQEVVDLVNLYASALTSAAGSDLGPAELRRRAGRLRAGSEAVASRVEQVVAHPCVERLAVGQASLMSTLAHFLEAAADGRAEDAAELSQELRRTDEAATLRENRACQARVGYTGPQGG